MQTAEGSKPLPVARNSMGEVGPLMGEIWMDRDGHYSLVLEVYEDEGEMCAAVLTLNTGKHWSREPFESWNQSQVDGLPYYRVRVG